LSVIYNNIRLFTGHPEDSSTRGGALRESVHCWITYLLRYWRKSKRKGEFCLNIFYVS